MIETLDALIAQQNEEGHDLTILRKVEHLWDARLQEALEAWLNRGTIGATSLRKLLDVLLDHGSQLARSRAEAVLDTPPSGAGDPGDYRFHAGMALLLHTPDAGWASVWPTMQRDLDHGRRLAEVLSYREDRHGGTVASRLSEEQLAALYEWLVEQYPPEEDPEPNRRAIATEVNIPQQYRVLA